MKHLLVLAASALTAWGSFAPSPGRAWDAQLPIVSPPVARGVLFSPDNRLLLVGYSQHTGNYLRAFYRLLEVRTGKQLCELPGIVYGFPVGAAFLPDNRILIAAASSRSQEEPKGPTLWDAPAGLQAGIQVGHLPCPEPMSPRSVAVSADGKLALTGHVEGHVKVWDLPARKVIRQLDRAQPQVSSATIVVKLCFMGGSRWAMSQSGDRLKIWDVTTGRRFLSGEKEAYWFPLAFSPSGKWAVVSAAENPRTGAVNFHDVGPRRLVLWELASGKQVLMLPAPGAFAAAFTPDGRGLLAASHNRTIQRWDLSGGKLLWSLTVDPPSVNATEAAGFSHNGRLAVTVAGETVKLWDLTSRKLLRLLAAAPEGTRDEMVLRLLAERVRDRNPDVRRDAVEDLAKVGKPALALLVKALAEDRSAEVRWQAARGLGKAGKGAQAARAALGQALRDADGKVRVMVAESLYRLNPADPGPLRRLRAALREPDVRVRLQVIASLAEIRDLGGDPAPALCEALKDSDARVRRRAAALLARNGLLSKQYVPALVGALKDADALVRVHAAYTLERAEGFVRSGPWPPPGYPAEQVAAGLAEVLRGRDRELRRHAAHLLWKLGGTAKAAAPALQAALRDADPLVRARVAAALLRIDANAPVAPLLIEAVRQRAAREFAVRAVAELGPRARPAVPALLDVLLTDVEHRVAASDTLAYLGEMAVPDLARALEGTSLGWWLFAAQTRRRTEDPAAFGGGPLGARLHPRVWIAYTLGRMEAKAGSAAPALARRAADRRELPSVRSTCLRALAVIGPPARAAVPALLPLLRDENPTLRQQASQALRAIDPEAAQRAGVPPDRPVEGNVP